MKRVFWLMSAVGLTLGQSGTAQASIQVSQGNYINVNTVNSTTNTTTNIDDAINQLIAQSQNSMPVVSVYQPTNSLNAMSSLIVTNQDVVLMDDVVSDESTSIVAKLSTNSAPSIAARTAARAAHAGSLGRCALYVRKALQSAGYEFTPNPSAYQYAHGTLADAGFAQISSDDYQPQVGDVVVFNRTAKNPHGHIQIYDGNQWVSDFRQPKFSPYSQHNGYTVWRDARYVDASANTGTMLALNEH
ncbi:CHAP domain-containing protein [Moraxella sp. Pampa]|uniref:CHAP domain-containing protein n=1 Tax=Moraxella sp. Pampa TaxID=3111978 RepID=UPI002B416002|nr:CHAP domain-containing protein [Moraxella sp. Pampa]